MAYCFNFSNSLPYLLYLLFSRKKKNFSTETTPPIQLHNTGSGKADGALILNPLMICLVDVKKSTVKKIVQIQDIEDVVVNPTRAQVIFRLLSDPKNPLHVEWKMDPGNSHGPEGFVGVLAKLYVVRSTGHKPLAASVFSGEIKTAPLSSAVAVRPEIPTPTSSFRSASPPGLPLYAVSKPDYPDLPDAYNPPRINDPEGMSLSTHEKLRIASEMKQEDSRPAMVSGEVPRRNSPPPRRGYQSKPRVSAPPPAGDGGLSSSGEGQINVMNNMVNRQPPSRRSRFGINNVNASPVLQTPDPLEGSARQAEITSPGRIQPGYRRRTPPPSTATLEGNGLGGVYPPQNPPLPPPPGVNQLNTRKRYTPTPSAQTATATQRFEI